MCTDISRPRLTTPANCQLKAFWLALLLSGAAVGAEVSQQQSNADSSSNQESILLASENRGENQVTVAELQQQLDAEIRSMTLSFASGGADGPFSWGTDNCESFKQGNHSIILNGVYSSAPIIDLKELWWGTKQPTCELTDQIEWGDMLYFSIEGFTYGDLVDVTVVGNGIRERSRVRVDTVVEVSGVGCIPQHIAARFSMVVSPTLGEGTFTIIAEGPERRVEANLHVRAPSWPKYGVNLGADSHPLLLTKGETVRLVYAGFPPGHKVTTVLFKDVGSHVGIYVKSGDSFEGRRSSESLPVGTFETQVNNSGWAIVDFVWPGNLGVGMYSFSVPDVTDLEFRAEKDRLRADPAEEVFLVYQGGNTVTGAAYSTIQFAARTDLTAAQAEQRPTDGFYELTVEPRSLPGLPYHKVVNVEDWDTLNVRDGPGVQYKVTEKLAWNASYVYVLQTVPVGNSSRWAQISCEGYYEGMDYGSGWINSHFLAPQ